MVRRERPDHGIHRQSRATQARRDPGAPGGDHRAGGRRFDGNGALKVYNSEGMEPLAPEDLVEEWSELSTSSLAPGARLGRYELLIPIAYGGMARVWAARLHGQRGFSKLVAIKTILPHLAHNPEFERMFLDEARIAAGVHHPNVCEIYELGEEGKVLYLAMEWVNGDSLVHVLRGINGKKADPIDVRIASRIVADACAGLHAAHELTDEDGRLLNVVHRDVSPHNLLVAQEGTVKVTDFGVAKALNQTHQATVAGQVKGKVAYMAPEQIGGMAFDRRSDVFAMGCVLYEAITGVQPFRGENDPQVMQAVLRGTYEPPSKLVRSIPAEVEHIIDRALAPEPRNRFATAERMRVALEEFLAKSGAVVTPTQVGTLVRQRLGPQLDKRRDHVRAAMQAVQALSPEGAGLRSPAASSPSHSGQSHSGHSHSGQSHSGVMVAAGPVPILTGTPQGAAPMRPPMPSNPMAPTVPMAFPVPGVPAVPGTPAGTPALGDAAAPRTARPPTQTTKYVVAAVAAFASAVVAGILVVALWMVARSHGSTRPTPAPAATVTTTAMATASPMPPPPVTTAAPMRTAAPPPPPSAAPVPVPSTVDISQLPPAKPAWTPPPPEPHRGGSGGVKQPALPANPY
jgi:serine/threonine protein kinase